MNLTHDDLLREAGIAGFQPEILEKAIRVFELLSGLNSHAYLRPRFVLKGGTAINLFHLDVPRLSVDIDLNYIGSVDRETMLAERPKVEQAIEAVCRRLNLNVRRVPSEHAGGKWRLGYPRSAGRTGTLELDLNFILRAPLWPPILMASRSLCGFRAQGVPVLDLHELIGGKLAALFGRTAARDVFDAWNLLDRDDLDVQKLRLAFVVYGGVNRRDWRTLERDEIHLDPVEVERNLVPVVRQGTAPPRAELRAWTERLIHETRERIAQVIPLCEHERAFLDRLNDHGVISPELITQDARLRGVIASHPGLLWKAENVRRRVERD